MAERNNIVLVNTYNIPNRHTIKKSITQARIIVVIITWPEKFDFMLVPEQ